MHSLRKMKGANGVLKTNTGLVLMGVLGVLIAPSIALASVQDKHGSTEMVGSLPGMICIGIFVIAYLLVMFEEKLHLAKSKPVMVAAGAIWVIVALATQMHGGDVKHLKEAMQHNIMEYGELFLFLLAAMTFINTMEERGVFDTLRVKLVNWGLSLRTLFWVTGLLAFFISPVADNLTTALLMGQVCMKVGGNNRKFIALACINVVVAANAGGAFSPFGDITTLMVWQKGHAGFFQFLVLFVPSLVAWVIPAFLMNLAIGNAKPEPVEESGMKLRQGWGITIILFLCTIATAVAFHGALNLLPAAGMMTGLGVLGFYFYYLEKIGKAKATTNPMEAGSHEGAESEEYNIFKILEKAEWDTLMFFYGIILCVGGLAQLGYLSVLSQWAYIEWGTTQANIAVGVLSAIVDNIPVMFAVLTMNPAMDLSQWLLVTLTAGIGGSMLSIGSAAGVALMGQAKGIYTFGAHLKWSIPIGIGYACAIGVHMVINM